MDVSSYFCNFNFYPTFAIAKICCRIIYVLFQQTKQFSINIYWYLYDQYSVNNYVIV